MRILAYEYLCSGVLAGTADAEPLRREGWLMLDAVVSDLARCPGASVDVLLDPGLLSRAHSWPATTSIHPVQAGTEEGAFTAILQRCDAALVIAPEFNNILFRRTRLVEEAKKPLLGCSAEAVRLTADKRDLAQRWAGTEIPTPPCLSWPAAGAGPWVLKPRDGAGSQATFLISHANQWESAVRQARQEGWAGELLGQPFVPGLPASVAFLVGPREATALPACQQLLSQDGRFHYQGARLPLPPNLNRRAQSLARRAIAAVPGLRGYVGVDLVLGFPANGSGDAVMEINPRLTTSYVALRRLAHFNLAEALLAAVGGQALPVMTWEQGPLDFRVA